MHHQAPRRGRAAQIRIGVSASVVAWALAGCGADDGRAPAGSAAQDGSAACGELAGRILGKLL